MRSVKCVCIDLQSTSAESLISEDRQALKSWANSLLNKTYNIKLRWVSDDATLPCGWYGVKCGYSEGEYRITEINFFRFNLTGPMPLGLGKLTGLQTLTLAYNNFSGGIPTDLGNCVNLRVSPV